MHALSCGASLSALPVGVVPHLRPCMLAWYLNIGHACWSIAILLVKCRWKKDGVWCYLYSCAIISDMSADTVTLSDMPACIVQLFQICMLVAFIHIVCKMLLYQVKIWSVINPSDMPTGRVLLPRVCKTCWLPSWASSWIYQILNDWMLKRYCL